MYELYNIQRTIYLLFTTMYQCYVKCTTLCSNSRSLITLFLKIARDRAVKGEAVLDNDFESTQTSVTLRSIEQFRAFDVTYEVQRDENRRAINVFRFSFVILFKSSNLRYVIPAIVSSMCQHSVWIIYVNLRRFSSQLRFETVAFQRWTILSHWYNCIAREDLFVKQWTRLSTHLLWVLWSFFIIFEFSKAVNVREKEREIFVEDWFTSI